MKVAVMNFSGNVGKTTVAREMLSPRMGAETIIAVETINAGNEGGHVQQVRGKQYDLVQRHLLSTDTAIVDVGASNVESFMRLMGEFAGSHEDFDYFLVPTVRERKQQTDTIATIDALMDMGVPADNILVVFNKVEADDELDIAFSIVRKFCAKANIPINDSAVIYENEVFERLRKLGKTLNDLVADDTDYRAQIRSAANLAEKERMTEMLLAKRLAATAHKNLDTVFTGLFS